MCSEDRAAPGVGIGKFSRLGSVEQFAAASPGLVCSSLSTSDCGHTVQAREHTHCFIYKKASKGIYKVAASL